MKQLVIDTTAYNGGIGIFENDQILGVFYLHVSQTHSQRLLYQIHTLMKSLNLAFADLEAITFSKGPGTFTGLRIGLSVAKTFATCLDIPLIMVSTLESYARTVQEKGYSAPLLDARKKEVYAALYKSDKDTCQPIIQPNVTSVEKFMKELPAGQTIHFTGSGAKLYKSIIQQKLEQNASFSDDTTLLQVIPALAFMGYEQYKKKDFADIIYSEPFYIRRSDAELAKEKKK